MKNKLYKVTFEFRNGLGEWKPDYMDNNGNGMTFDAAKYTAYQIACSSVCPTQYVQVVEMD